MNQPTRAPAPAMSAGSLADALRRLGKSEIARQALMTTLRDYEARAEPGSGVNIREEVTGPILDAMVGHGVQMTKTLANGLKMSFRYTSKIMRDFVLSNEPTPDHVWEPQTTRTLLALTRGAKHVVIGGAYIGDHAVPIADQLRGSGVVHSFELSADNADMLALNAYQNGLDNIRVNRIGLWSTADVHLMLNGEDSHAAPSVAEAAAPGTFEATTIDAYGQGIGIKAIDLIMLDIEGGELEALKGARSYLSMNAERAPEVVFEIHGSYVDWSSGLPETEVVRLLTDVGYTVFAIRDYHSNVAMAGRPIELVELDNIYLKGPPHGFNMLAVKRPQKLDPALFRRCRGVSPKLLFHRDPMLHAPLS